MPTVGVIRDELFERLGRKFSTDPDPDILADEEFDELCFDYGIELDEVTSEREMKKKETGKEDKDLSETIIYKIEVPANRYDLLCIEGIALALGIFIGHLKQPLFRLSKPAAMHRLVAQKETGEIRRYVVAAVLRGVTFTKSNYDSFIDLQDKLHQNIGRRRTLVSIGTHDLDTLDGPFTYEALPPPEIKFAPLNKPGQVVDGNQLMELLEKDLHLRPYLPIIRDAPRYPVIYDSKRRVLSLPPIINSDHSKITLNTKNVFIEVTATDKTKAHIVLQIISTAFSEYCAEKFTVEPVEVVYPGGGKDGADLVEVTPVLEIREQFATVEYINRLVGFAPPLDSGKISALLTRMGLTSQPANEGAEVRVEVPCTRSDVLHACDIMEDVAIGFGFNNLTKRLPQSVTIGRQLPLNKLTDLLRVQVAAAGYTEVLNFILCSMEDNHQRLLRPVDGKSIRVGNPKGEEYETCRRTLLSGILKSLAHNKALPIPLKLFEIGDCVVKDQASDTGAKNVRQLCALFCSSTAGFEVVHGLLDRVMTALNIPHVSDPLVFFEGNRVTTENWSVADVSRWLKTRGQEDRESGDKERQENPLDKLVPEFAAQKIAGPQLMNLSDSLDKSKLPVDGDALLRLEKAAAKTRHAYYLRGSNDPAYFPGRQADVLYCRLGRHHPVGLLGAIHPLVLKNFELTFPAAALELEVGTFHNLP